VRTRDLNTCLNMRDEALNTCLSPMSHLQRIISLYMSSCRFSGP